jgi:predicted DNA-binding transcriptional regulator YafY
MYQREKNHDGGKGTHTRRIERLVRIALLMQSGLPQPMFQLQELFSCSRRTIFRDLKVVQAIGIPVKFNETHQGYCVPNESASRVRFTGDELVAIAFALSTGPRLPSSKLNVLVESAIAKMASRLTNNERERLANLRTACGNAHRGNGCVGNLGENFDSLIQAIAESRAVRICFRSDSELTSTKLFPVGLLYEGESWSVKGRSSLHRSDKTFQMDAIVGVEVLQETFKRRPR